jgi:ATP-binding cassette subfamily B protein
VARATGCVDARSTSAAPACSGAASAATVRPLSEPAGAPERPPTPAWWRPASLRLALAQVPRTVRLVLELDRASTGLLVLLQVLGGLSPVLVAWVGKAIVDGVVRAIETGDPADRRAALMWIGVELAVVTVDGALGRLGGFVESTLGVRLGHGIMERVLARAAALELARFEDPAIQDRLQNARREAGTRPMRVFVRAIGLVRSALTLASLGAVLVVLGPLLLPLVALAALPAILGEAQLAGEAFRLLSWRAPEGRRLRYYEWLLTREGAVAELRLYGLGPLLLERYRALHRRFFAEDRALALRRSVRRFGYGLLSLAAFYAGYLWIAWQTVSGALSLGEMTMGLVLFRRGQDALGSILSSLGAAYEDNLFMSNLFGFLDLPDAATPEDTRLVAERGEDGRPRAAPGPGPVGASEARSLAERGEDGRPRAAPGPGPVGASEARSLAERGEDGRPRAAPGPGPVGLGFVLQNVGFRYPGRREWALRGIDLSIGAEETLAVVGDNGAGKSTLVKLLCGLYTPTEGRILLDGLPLAEIPTEALRARLGVVMQDFVRYQLTARENVGFGRLDALDDADAIARAADQGGARELVERLPAGWETPLGRWFEGGVELSGGQWQRVAVSRAFLRDPDILILDEPTASLDAEAERRLFERIQDLAAGRMAIVISHRIATARAADRIVVLRGGRVEELGPHEALLAANGRYAHLFRIQAEGYLDAYS